MAAHHPQVDLFDIIYNAIVLVLTDRYEGPCFQIYF